MADFFATNTQPSLSGGGPNQAGVAGINQQSTSIHRFPSTLLSVELGGIGHVLIGIAISLVVIVRALSMISNRLGYELERTQGSQDPTVR